MDPRIDDCCRFNNGTLDIEPVLASEGDRINDPLVKSSSIGEKGSGVGIVGVFVVVVIEVTEAVRAIDFFEIRCSYLGILRLSDLLDVE